MENIAKLQKPEQGTIKYLFDKLNEDGTYREEIGFQFQDSNLPKRIKVKLLIKLFGELYEERVSKAQVIEMIEVFGVQEFINKPSSKLSGGQRQRLNLLLAVLHQPKIMILDEFITGLDITSVVRIIDYIQAMKKKNNSSMIIITHQPEEIHELADRVLVLKNGEFVSEWTKPQIIKKYKTYSKFMREVI